MANSVNLTFGVSDLSQHIFKEVSQKPAKFLECRLVSHPWEAKCDELLKRMWSDLRFDPPEGGVNIPLEMEKIDTIPNPFIIKFRKLADVFRDYGVRPLEKETTPISIAEFRTLQNRTYDRALKTIWSNCLREKILPFIANPPSLDANGNEVRDFLNDPTHSHALIRIEQLDLRHICITTVPPELNRLSGLRMLDLGYNQLSEVLDFNLPNLRRLNLSYNQLKEIPNFAHLQNLIMLGIDHNRLEKVSDFSHLQNLETLELCNNRLIEVSDFKLPKLRILMLDHNLLRKIPNFVNLQSLIVLALRHNQLSEVPNFTHLQNVTQLCLDGNLLDKVPNFTELPNLRALILQGNPLMSIPDEILQRFSNDIGIRSFVSQLSYQCQSPLATLYQEILKNELSKDEIRIIFDSLNEKDKDAIYWMSFYKAGTPKINCHYREWGSTYAFEDLYGFGLAVQKAILGKFNVLSLEQRTQVYSKIYNLAGEPLTFSRWGEQEARDNLPRLADALS
jgi:Leucine-rich repeat (LRR) protein